MLNSDKSSRILSKPSPQILDEMDDNIRAATEAARKAEEAARQAKQAADAALRSSVEAGKRAEEARKAGEKAAETATRAAAEAAAKAEQVAKAAHAAAEKAAKKAETADKQAKKADISDIGAKKYLVIFEKTVNNYSAYSPDLPGCIATGRTRAEVEKSIREAISFHIEGLKEDGLPIPKPAAFTEYVEV